MKRSIFILILAVTSFTGFSQGAFIQDYFEKYADHSEFTKVTVNSKMFSLFTELEANTPEEKEFLKAVSKLKGLKILAADSIPDAAGLYDQACNKVMKQGYEELMSVKDAEEDMKFVIKDNNGRIEELLMIVGGHKSFVLLSLYGEIDLKNISKMARSMNIDGLEKLSKIDEVENE